MEPISIQRQLFSRKPSMTRQNDAHEAIAAAQKKAGEAAAQVTDAEDRGGTVVIKMRAQVAGEEPSESSPEPSAAEDIAILSAQFHYQAVAGERGNRKPSASSSTETIPSATCH